MGKDFNRIIEKYLGEDLKNSGIINKQHITTAISSLGRTGLGTSINFSKAFIENYFLDESKSQPIINLIDEMVSKQNKEKELN